MARWPQFPAFVGFVLSSRSRVAPGAGLAARGRGQSEQAPEFFISVGEVSALGAVERITEGRQRRGGALGLAEGTPGVQTWNTGGDGEKHGFTDWDRKYQERFDP